MQLEILKETANELDEAIASIQPTNLTPEIYRLLMSAQAAVTALRVINSLINGK